MAQSMKKTWTRTPPMPKGAGISLKAEHYHDVLEKQPKVAFFEVHSENYFSQGGAPHAMLTKIRDQYALSCHGVGLSLGSADRLSQCHLKRLKALIDRYQPELVSEHVAWCGLPGLFLNDLLPLPYTQEALTRLVDHIDETQNYLGRRILIENPSTYLSFEHSTMDEAEFMAEACLRSGAGLLLDLNNVYVSASNHGFDPHDWLRKIPADSVGEIHLAGHTVRDVDGVEIRIDDHGSEVPTPVWGLYADMIAQLGPVPTLIEWDSNLPPLAVLVNQAQLAERILSEERVMGAAHG